MRQNGVSEPYEAAGFLLYFIMVKLIGMIYAVYIFCFRIASILAMRIMMNASFTCLVGTNKVLSAITIGPLFEGVFSANAQHVCRIATRTAVLPPQMAKDTILGITV